MQLTRWLAFAASVVSTGALALALPNDPPVPVTGGNAGNDYVVDCNNTFAPGSSVTTVQLNGSGSYDPQGTPVTFLWFEECPYGYFPDPTSPTPTYVMDMTGLCSRSCLMELRVTSGGQMVKKQFRITVQDSTPPLISAPPDVLGVWGDSTATGATGFATAIDNCDAAPFISFTELNVTPGGIGSPELVLQRVWTATDCTGFQSSTTQTITLLSPTGAAGATANLDFDPTNCPNTFAPLQTGTVDVLLLGSTKFDVTKIVPSSLRLWVRNQPAVSIAPATFLVKDLGSITAVNFGDCNGSAHDGKKDMRLRFNRISLTSQLGLANYASGQTVEIAVTGRMKNGKVFATRDSVTIQ